MEDKRRIPKFKKIRMKKNHKNWIKPILGVHTKYSLQVMDEIKPPFDKKARKKLKKSIHQK